MGMTSKSRTTVQTLPFSPRCDSERLDHWQSLLGIKALVEIGFAIHPVDGLNLRDDDYLDRVALGIARGIRATLGGGLAG